MTPKYTILQRPRRALLPRISRHTRWSGCFPTRSQPRPRNKITNPSPTSNPPPPPRSSSIFSSPTLGPPPSPTSPLPPFPRPNLPRLPVRRHSTTPSDAQNRGTTSLLAEANPSMFWEREPFVWSDEADRVSRFVSLGAFGGEPTPGKKQRWFYAFSIAPNSPTAAPVARPANATKNPFTEAPASFARPMKRPFESTADSGENFIFGNNVQKPLKRTRVVEGDPGKPPPGYKCHRCESGEVGRDFSFTRLSLKFLCAAASTSSTTAPSGRSRRRGTCARYVIRRAISCATAPRGSRWGIRAGRSPSRGTCAARAGAKARILWTTVLRRVKGPETSIAGRGDADAGRRRRSHRTNAGSAYRTPISRAFLCRSFFYMSRPHWAGAENI
ncbi:hypothetical protein B0H14DRAFT_431589 [Mycena olivaceomarginata]|nr:hypothetical protein B0H14DRAFT_431589 [Mycena olivaceomarginata]